MKIAVQTSLPAFQNDIGDVVRLFYGEGAAVEETQQADARLTHIHEESNGEWRETFVLTDCSGRTEQNTLSAPAVSGTRMRCIYRHSLLHDALRVLLVLIRRNRRRAIGRAVSGGAAA